MVLNVDKEELKERFKQKDWDYVFNQAYSISDYIISKKFKIIDPDIKDDIKQECVENLYKKIQQNKVDADRNVFSFIWQNSNFRILEILRKNGHRKKIAQFMSFDNADFKAYEENGDTSMRYAPERVLHLE